MSSHQYVSETWTLIQSCWEMTSNEGCLCPWVSTLMNELMSTIKGLEIGIDRPLALWCSVAPPPSTGRWHGCKTLDRSRLLGCTLLHFELHSQLQRKGCELPYFPQESRPARWEAERSYNPKWSQERDPGLRWRKVIRKVDAVPEAT